MDQLKKKNANKYLTFVDTDKNKEVLEKYKNFGMRLNITLKQ